MVYTPRFFSSKCSLFHNSNVFGSCIIHILYIGRAKIKKNNYGAKRLSKILSRGQICPCIPCVCYSLTLWPVSQFFHAQHRNYTPMLENACSSVYLHLVRPSTPWLSCYLSPWSSDHPFSISFYVQNFFWHPLFNLV